MGRGRHPTGPPPLDFYQPMPPPPPHFIPPPPRVWTPWLVPLIFLANMALFCYAMYINDCPSNPEADECLFSKQLGRFAFQPIKENPLLGPRGTALQKLGALQKELVVDQGEGWRLFSCMFLHAGVIHLLLNMFSLLFTGIRLEKEFGFLRIGVLYALAGLGGSLLSVIRMEKSTKPLISVGASGALFGLLGSMLSELFINWSLYTNKCAALVTLVIVIALNLAIGFLPNVDNSAHIGGFVFGYFLGFVLLIRPQYGYVSPKHIPPGYHAKTKSRHTICQYVFVIASIIILILG